MSKREEVRTLTQDELDELVRISGVSDTCAAQLRQGFAKMEEPGQSKKGSGGSAPRGSGHGTPQPDQRPMMTI